MIHEQRSLISREAIQRYISRRHEDVKHGKRYLATRDWISLATIGHKLQGNAKTFGFGDLEPLGGELENAALEQNSVLCQEKLSQLSEWLLTQV